MIHSNFRKILKRFVAGATAGSTSYIPIFDYTDISGYTGVDITTDRLALYANDYWLANYIPNYTLTQLETYTRNIQYAVIGNSTENEPEYYLGQVLSQGLLFTTSGSKSTVDLLCSTTISNTSSDAITFDEIGLIAHLYQSSGSFKWNGKQYMNLLMIKEQLETPVEIPANSSICITFNILGESTIS